MLEIAWPMTKVRQSRRPRGQGPILRELEMPLGLSLVEAWTIGDAMGLLRYSRP